MFKILGLFVHTTTFDTEILSDKVYSFGLPCIVTNVTTCQPTRDHMRQIRFLDLLQYNSTPVVYSPF